MAQHVVNKKEFSHVDGCLVLVFIGRKPSELEPRRPTAMVT
jgi:hypothetical protein